SRARAKYLEPDRSSAARHQGNRLQEGLQRKIPRNDPRIVSTSGHPGGSETARPVCGFQPIGSRQICDSGCESAYVVFQGLARVYIYLPLEEGPDSDELNVKPRRLTVESWPRTGEGFGRYQGVAGVEANSPVRFDIRENIVSAWQEAIQSRV